MNTPNPNRAANEKAVAELRGHLAHHERPFSNSAIEKQHQKNKLTVAERLDLLFDPGEERFEIGTFAAMGMYEEHGEIVSAGVRTVLGRVSGHDCMVIASDSMVKGGAWFPLTAKKTLLAQEIALENRLPVIYLVDSAGIFLPLAAESFADRDHAGRIFYHNARLSALGVPQIAAVMGPCVAGGAYIPALCDELLMVRGTSGIFLAGPHLVKAAIGEEIDIEKLGGADTHMQISGMADYEDDSDTECLERIRRLAAHWPTLPPCSFPIDEPAPPELDPERLLEILPADRRAAYDMREILKCIVDSGSWEEYKADYGATILAGTARIEGRVVGILANQRLITRTGRGEMQIGGVLYSDSADKGARFVLVCNQKRIPILFFQDVTGFMVGGRAEQGGIIKDGAKLVNAVSNSSVPKLTIVVGNSNGAGNYALCGRAYGPRFMIAWPSARIAVMGGDQAASTLLSIEKTKAKAALTKEQEAELLERLRKVYDESASPYHAASRLWIDAVIDPRNSRAVLAHLLRIACRRDPAEGFRVGVFQV